MGANYDELTTQLWDLLTKEEIVEGVVSITYEFGFGKRREVFVFPTKEELLKSL